MKKITLSLLAIGALFFGNTYAQQRNPDYLQAEKFSGTKLQNMLFSTTIDPHFFGKGGKFWYEYKTSDGKQWYIVDPATKSSRLLFDLDDLAAQITEIMGDPFEARQLPIRELKASEDGKKFTFYVTSSKDDKPEKPGAAPEKKRYYFEYHLGSNKLEYIKDKEKEPKRLDWASVSPDKKTVVYAKDCNLYKMSMEDYRKAQKDEKDSTIVEVQLTKDGMPDFGYGIPYSISSTDTLCNGKRRGVYGMWSPDSKHFALTIEDNRKVKDLWVINALSEPRPTLETYKYHMAGEPNAPEEHLYIFDMEKNTRKEIKVSAWKDQTLHLEYRPYKQSDRDKEFYHAVWQGDNSRFFLTRRSRDLHRIDVCTYTIGQDSIVPIVKERMNTYQETRPIHVLGGGKEFIQWSERDGWAHLYLYNEQGKLLNRITKGAWHVERIVNIDPATRTVYFIANGREKGENPYYQHLYSANLNGGSMRQITKGNFFHSVQMDDDALYVVDNYSRVNTVPATDLLDRHGKKVMSLQKSDFSQLFAAGYKHPETFTVKAADGVTDLYGVMYKPYNFDSTKVYPIIEYVYPGPQVESVQHYFTRMTVRTDRLAQAGFIVVTVGHRGGHPARSKWYHNYGYGNLRDYPLADHKSAVEQLAARHPFIDINKVGIHGHSGGGFMSTAAMFMYPDFYKAAVSAAGNHDNRIYNRWWSETHHGVKETVNEKGDTTFVYSIATNPEIAYQLKGNLMLVHGDTDDNVHIANTIRVANALIRYNKRFDMLYLPSQRHSFGDMDEYFYWRMVDFFSEHLKGKKETLVDIPAR